MTRRIYEEQDSTLIVDDEDAYLASCLSYVEELNAVDQTFASRVSSGIRSMQGVQPESYAHAMAVLSWMRV